MKIKVTTRDGKVKIMNERVGRALVKMGRVYVTRDMVAQPVKAKPEKTDDIIISDAVREFAEQNGVELVCVKGTGINGRINKKDVEAVIAARGE